MLRVVLSLITLSVPLLDGFAEGSCTWEDAKVIVEQSPALLAHLEETLEIADTGFALRLGPHYTDLSGQRVAPYTFQAVSKTEAATPLELVVEAELIFFDQAGNPVPSGEAARAHQVRQVLRGVRLRAPSEENAAEESPRVREKRTAWIRERRDAIASAEVSESSLDFGGGENEPSGTAVYRRDPESGAIRSITVRLNHPGEEQIEESFYFHEDELFLAERRERSWMVHPENPNISIRQVEDTRYLFTEGQIYLALRKSYQGVDEEQLDREAEAASEERIALSGAESMQFLARASRLSVSREPGEILAIYADGS